MTVTSQNNFSGRLTSNSEEWGTPSALFDALNSSFRFELDAAASKWNAKTARYFTKENDALKQDWYMTANQNRPMIERHLPSPACPAIWLNPPYGRKMGDWIRKARDEAQKGVDVVVLIFARSCTKWWYETVQDALSITFLKGRVPFVRPDGSSKGSAPASSVILHFSPKRNSGHHYAPSHNTPHVAFWDWKNERLPDRLKRPSDRCLP